MNETLEKDRKAELGEAIGKAILTPERLENGSARVRVSPRLGYDIRSAIRPPIDRYHSDGHITYAQRLAGKKLYVRWYIGGLRRDIAAAQFDEFRGDYDNMKRLEAWEEYRKAVDSIIEEQARIVTLSVVCWEETTKNRMGQLRNGLNDLIKFFGLDEHLTCGKI